MSDFREAVSANLRRVSTGAWFDVLIDLTDYPPQAAAIVDAQKEIINKIGASGMRRGATVLASTLMRLQVDRVNDVKHKHYFTNIDDARNWLASPFVKEGQKEDL